MMHSINSRKGFVLTLDAAFAAALAMIILIVAFGYSSASSSPGDISSLRIASDIVAVLSYDGTLQTYDESIIAGRLASLLPQNLELDMMIEEYSADGALLSRKHVGSVTGSYLSGRWIFRSAQKLYAVDYKVSYA